MCIQSLANGWLTQNSLSGTCFMSVVKTVVPKDSNLTVSNIISLSLIDLSLGPISIAVAIIETVVRLIIAGIAYLFSLCFGNPLAPQAAQNSSAAPAMSTDEVEFPQSPYCHSDHIVSPAEMNPIRKYAKTLLASVIETDAAIRYSTIQAIAYPCMCPFYLVWLLSKLPCSSEFSEGDLTL